MLYLSSLLLTVIVYCLCKAAYTRWHAVYLHPILTSLVVLICGLSASHVPYHAYAGGTQVLTDMLGPATVAFAVPLYKHFALLKQHAVEIVTGLLAGSLIAVATSVGFARLAGLGPMILDSIAPRSVTTPIAMAVSTRVGGTAVLTSVFVMITAFVGLVVGPLAISLFRIHSPVARGMLLGMGAHGIGTTRAFEIGSLEGTFASLSMVIAAIMTVGLAPFVVHWLT